MMGKPAEQGVIGKDKDRVRVEPLFTETMGW